MGIAEQYRQVSAEVAAVCERVAREPQEVLVLAVSKTVGVEGVRQAYDAGARAFGENRPDPLMEKHAAFPDASWHFIGNIQSRRIKDIVPCADVIHSLYQIKHAQKIDEEAARLGKVQRVLVEVNVSGEESKSGLAPAELFAFLDECAALQHVQACGLMTMAPQGSRAVAKQCFADLRMLLAGAREHLAQAHPDALDGFDQLSMGMTDDWREAIEEGSTIVRIGRAIFA